jgi:hypothetical protein
VRRQETNAKVKQLSAEESKLESRQAVRAVCLPQCPCYGHVLMRILIVLQVLKKALYSRFGQSINLEDN